MDGSHLSLAGRAGLPLVVLFALLWGGNSTQPAMTGAPPAQPPVRATVELRYGVLGQQVHVVRPAARHGQSSRRGFTPVAVLATALVGAMVATAGRDRFSDWSRLNGRLLTLGPRAPPPGRP
jgi:hypothetical protein